MRRPPPAARRALAFILALAGACSSPAGAAQAAAARPSAAPDDPLFGYQWNLRALELPAAWAISRGRGATVAVLDTGVAYENRGPYRRAPDLAGTRFARGWDFVDDDAHPNDVAPADGRRSHGTLMAGLIAQTTGNGLGTAGVAPAATIMPIRVLRPDLSGSAGDIARGLRFAADHGADVANVSVAGPTRSRALERAIGYAVGKGVTVVAASGNEGVEAVSMPAADPRVIAVGAVDRALRRAPYSNYGEALDVVAPSGAGARTDTGNGSADGVLAQALKGGPASFCFCFSASTSAATAQVSGVAALIVASGRATTPSAVGAALRESARDLGPRGPDPQYGAGLVQALAALGGRRAGPGAAGRAARDGDGGASGWLVLGGAAAALAALAGGVRLARRRAA